jgi:hypothetical protein
VIAPWNPASTRNGPSHRARPVAMASSDDRTAGSSRPARRHGLRQIDQRADEVVFRPSADGLAAQHQTGGRYGDAAGARRDIIAILKRTGVSTYRGRARRPRFHDRRPDFLPSMPAEAEDPRQSTDVGAATSG